MRHLPEPEQLHALLAKPVQFSQPGLRPRRGKVLRVDTTPRGSTVTIQEEGGQTTVVPAHGIDGVIRCGRVWHLRAGVMP